MFGVRQPGSLEVSPDDSLEMAVERRGLDYISEFDTSTFNNAFRSVSLQATKDCTKVHGGRSRRICRPSAEAAPRRSDQILGASSEVTLWGTFNCICHEPFS